MSTINFLNRLHPKALMSKKKNVEKTEKIEQKSASEKKEGVKVEKVVLPKLEVAQKKAESVTAETISPEPIKEIPKKKEHTSELKIAYVVVVLIIILGLAFGGFSLFKSSKIDTSKIKDVDQLHALNREGKLAQDQGYIYNEFSFVKHQGLWWTEVQGVDALVKMPLHFGPREVEFIKINGQLEPEFNADQKVYIAVNPNVADKFYTLAITELSVNIAQGIGRLPIGACTSNNDTACDNRTIVSCENTQGKPVVELAIASEPSVEIKGTCIKISGEGYNLVRSMNRALFRWYGIMQ